MYLYRRRGPRPVSREGDAAAAAPKRPVARLKLDTGFPAMGVSEEFVRLASARSRGRAHASRSPKRHGRLEPSPDAPCPRGWPARGLAIDPPLPPTPPEPVPIRGVRENGPAMNFATSGDGGVPIRGPPSPPHPGGSSADGGQLFRWVTLIQDFLRTMDQFLVAQGQVMEGCFHPGDARFGLVGGCPVCRRKRNSATPTATLPQLPAARQRIVSSTPGARSWSPGERSTRLKTSTCATTRWAATSPSPARACGRWRSCR